MNHHEHHNVSHKNGEHGMGMSHGDASSYLKRFWIVTFLLVPLLFTHAGIASFFGVEVLPYAKWVGFLIATIIFSFSLVFFEHAGHEIKAKKYGMMTLVSLAVGAGYLFSVLSTFSEMLNVEFYLEISTLVWVLLFGHYLEAKSSGAAGNALQEVAKLLPKQAHKIINGEEEDVPVDSLKEGDIVLVKPGEKVPADGNILKGSAHVDESLISGESKPLQKGEGNSVVAGAICLDGSLTVSLVRVGEHSTVGQIKKLIAEAGKTKPRSQRIADKASALLTFIAGVTALLTLLVWTFVLGETFVFAITLAITVLVIACPHALGLAIPTVTTIATSLAVKNGFFIKDLSKIETIRKASYVVFDKTGTLTEGSFGVTDVVPHGEHELYEVLKVASSLEKHSSHIIGRSIVAYARDEGVEAVEVSDFKNIPGQGIEGVIDDEKYKVGNGTLVKNMGDEVSVPKDTFGTVAYVSNDREIIGHIVLSDAIKDSAYKAIQNLHDMGVKTAMLTGDNEQVAKYVAQELKIDKYFAEVMPEDKYIHIQELQKKGNTVLMVGDGVNDAPALAQADAGIAIGAGTDVAVESGDVVLTKNDPQDVARLILLSKKVYRKMVENLVWALGYNVIAIPAAAGVFAFWGFFLRPEIGALLMSFSTVIVVFNALLLKKARL